MANLAKILSARLRSDYPVITYYEHKIVYSISILQGLISWKSIHNSIFIRYLQYFVSGLNYPSMLYSLYNFVMYFNKIHPLQYIFFFNTFLGSKQSNNKHKKSSSAGKSRLLVQILLVFKSFACKSTYSNGMVINSAYS